MQPRVTEPFTKAVIHVVPAVDSSLRVVAGLQRLLSFPANSEFIIQYFCQAYLHMHKFVLSHSSMLPLMLLSSSAEV